MPTRVLCDSPVFHAEYDYDASLRVTAVRVEVTGDRDVRVTATRNSDGVSHQHTFLAGQTQVLVVPTNAAVRLQLTTDALGRLDGVTWMISPL